MSLESDIFDTLKSLVSNRVYPDVAPLDPTAPYIVWQQVGGEAINFMEVAQVGKRNARIQVACWATTRVAASNMARSVENAMVQSTMNPFVVGAFTAVYEDETKLYGTRQDFSIFY
jgi:hypothetical protein